MKIFRVFLYILIAVVMVNFSCGDNSSIVSGDSNDPTDGTTGATPDTGGFYPAEDGPIRSMFGEPEFDADTLQLRISGLVDSAFALTWTDIQKHSSVTTDTMIMYCVEGWEVWGVWKGIRVQDLLQQAGLHPNAAYLNFECVDGFKSVISLSYAQKYDAMLAYEVNGKLLQNHDGFPLRLIAFGKYGYKWAKWVNKIYVLSFNQVAAWPSDEWLDAGDVPVERRRPYEGEDVEPLEY